MGCCDCKDKHGESFVSIPVVDLKYNFANFMQAQWQIGYTDDELCDLALWYWLAEEQWRNGGGT